MAFKMTHKDGSVTQIDGTTGEILMKQQSAENMVEVESVVNHVNPYGQFSPAARPGSVGGRYLLGVTQAADFVARGFVKLVAVEQEAPADAESKMAEAEGVEVAAPVEAAPKKAKK